MRIKKANLVKIIREAVVRAVEEAKFNPQTLNSMNFQTPEQVAKYVSSLKLRELGKGSARIVFALDSRRALKVAINNKGIGQNEAEVENVTNPSAKKMFAAIYNYDPRYKWLVSELVRPMDSEKEFEQLTGIRWVTFAHIISAYGFGENQYEQNSSQIRKIVQSGCPIAKHYASDPRDLEYQLNSPFLKNVLQTLPVLTSGLMPNDIKRLEHWGKTPDQRVVLLDYGFTSSVAIQHYVEPDIGNDPTGKQ